MDVCACDSKFMHYFCEYNLCLWMWILVHVCLKLHYLFVLYFLYFLHWNHEYEFNTVYPAVYEWMHVCMMNYMFFSLDIFFINCDFSFHVLSNDSVCNSILFSLFKDIGLYVCVDVCVLVSRVCLCMFVLCVCFCIYFNVCVCHFI